MQCMYVTLSWTQNLSPGRPTHMISVPNFHDSRGKYSKETKETSLSLVNKKLKIQEEKYHTWCHIYELQFLSLVNKKLKIIGKKPPLYQGGKKMGKRFCHHYNQFYRLLVLPPDMLIQLLRILKVSIFIPPTPWNAAGIKWAISYFLPLITIRILFTSQEDILRSQITKVYLPPNLNNPCLHPLGILSHSSDVQQQQPQSWLTKKIRCIKTVAMRLRKAKGKHYGSQT